MIEVNTYARNKLRFVGNGKPCKLRGFLIVLVFQIGLSIKNNFAIARKNTSLKVEFKEGTHNQYLFVIPVIRIFPQLMKVAFSPIRKVLTSAASINTTPLSQICFVPTSGFFG